MSSYELSINKHIAVNLCSPKSTLSNNYFLQEPKTLEAHISFIIQWNVLYNKIGVDLIWLKYFTRQSCQLNLRLY